MFSYDFRQFDFLREHWPVSLGFIFATFILRGRVAFFSSYIFPSNFKLVLILVISSFVARMIYSN